MDDAPHARSRNARVRAASDAYRAGAQTAAWRAPATPRFDSRPANDFGRRTPEPIQSAEIEVEPASDGTALRWLIAIAGALIVALMAVLAGSAMAL